MAPDGNHLSRAKPLNFMGMAIFPALTQHHGNEPDGMVYKGLVGCTAERVGSANGTNWGVIG